MELRRFLKKFNDVYCDLSDLVDSDDAIEMIAGVRIDMCRRASFAAARSSNGAALFRFKATESQSA